MLFLRIMGKVLLFTAFLAVAYDGAQSVASPGEGIALTSLADHLKIHAPQAQEAMHRWIEQHGPPYLWSWIIQPLLIIPLALMGAILGSLLFLAGYKRPPLEIAS